MLFKGALGNCADVLANSRLLSTKGSKPVHACRCGVRAVTDLREWMPLVCIMIRGMRFIQGR